MSDLDSWYDDAQDTAYGVRNGRYDFPAPPGHKRPPRGYMRTTNLAAAFSDQKQLQNWLARMYMLGLRTEEGETLLDEFMATDLDAMDPQRGKAFLEDVAQKFADAAGAGHGARRGTARHLMLQTAMEGGELLGTRRMRLQFRSLLDALARHHLEPLPGWSERRVCHTGYGVMGTLDLGVRCLLTGQVGILDLKTQRQFWSYLEICGQQHVYDSADWTWEGPSDPSGQWVKRPIEWNLTGAAGGLFEGRRVALLAHMPQAPGPHQLPVEIHEVVLDYGSDVIETALRNVELRSLGRAESAARRVGGLRRVSSGPIRVPSLLGVDTSAIAE